MRVNSLVAKAIFSAVVLSFLTACGGSDAANHTQYGGLWDQVFSQAMTDNPGKGGE